MDRRAIMGGAGVARLGVLGDLLRTAARGAASPAGAVADLGGSGPAPAAAVAPDDPVAIVFTSGTTGVPKGACFTHRNLLAVAEIEARRYARGAAPAAKHLAAGLSFAHIGTMARIAIQLSQRGATLIHDAFDPAAVLETIERERLDALGGIPTQVIMLLDHPDRARRDLSSLKSVLLGGAPSSPELIRRVRDTLGVEVSVRYSSTEVAIATASLADDPPERLATTVGRATPGVELRIVDERNAPVPAGTPGEVVVRSPAAMVRYWRDPEATAATIDAEGWVHTGDVGFLDDAGYLHLRGRQSEMFIRVGSRGGARWQCASGYRSTSGRSRKAPLGEPGSVVVVVAAGALVLVTPGAPSSCSGTWWSRASTSWWSPLAAWWWCWWSRRAS